MTDIKLRPGCELAKAINGLEGAVHQDMLGLDRRAAADVLDKARAHLLEVIQKQIIEGYKRGVYSVGYNLPHESQFSLSPEIANEIMGCVGDD